MKNRDIRELSIEEAQLKIQELKQEYLELTIRRQVKPISNPQRLLMIRKTIARILTAIRQKELINA